MHAERRLADGVEGAARPPPGCRPRPATWSREARRILQEEALPTIPEAVAARRRGRRRRGGSTTRWRGERPRARCARRCGRLDEKMDEHLAFARKSSLREYAESIGVAVAIALLLRAFVVEAFQIPSGSMIPTLEVGDHIFVSKFSYGLGIPSPTRSWCSSAQPQRGDVIVFKYPARPEDRLHQARGRRCRATRSRSARTRSSSTASRCRASTSTGPCSYEEAPGGQRPSATASCGWRQLDGAASTSVYQDPDGSRRLSTARPWSRPATCS